MEDYRLIPEGLLQTGETVLAWSASFGIKPCEFLTNMR